MGTPGAGDKAQFDFGQTQPRPGGADTQRACHRQLETAAQGKVVDKRTDIWAFDATLDAGDAEAALALYRGHFLALDAPVPWALQARDRAACGQVAPPQGLCLTRVEYGPEPEPDLGDDEP